jgi:tetraacyldisaccharide 4'-kinase
MGANVLILDDAFQHRDVMRDINIVLIDAARPFGNGFLLPAGPLREPLSALERADIIIAMGTADHYGSKSFDLTEFQNKIRPFNKYAPVFYAIRKPTALRKGGAGSVYPPGDLKGKKICAFSGIANPAAFKKTLMFLDADVVRFIAFTDHHPYNNTDVKQLQDAFDRAGAEFMVTTEKDVIKLDPFPFFLKDLLILTIEMDILSAREAFETLLLGKLQDT